MWLDSDVLVFFGVHAMHAELSLSSSITNFVGLMKYYDYVCFCYQADSALDVNSNWHVAFLVRRRYYFQVQLFQAAQ